MNSIVDYLLGEILASIKHEDIQKVGGIPSLHPTMVDL